MRMYWAAPLFTQMQRAWNREIAEVLEREMYGLQVILPQAFRVEGKYNDPGDYAGLHRRCLAAVESADVVGAVLDGADVDSGVAFTMGYAAHLGRPVIGIRTDYRPGGADHGVNMMCARACKYLVKEYAFQEDPRVVASGIIRRLKKLVRETTKGQGSA